VTPAKKRELLLAQEREQHKERETEQKRKEAEKVAADLAEKNRREQEAGAIVELFQDDHFRGRRVEFHFDQTNENFHSITFDNEASSARWNVPPGWKVVLWGDNTFHGGSLEFRGRGDYVDIEKQTNKGDEASSIQWVKE